MAPKRLRSRDLNRNNVVVFIGPPTWAPTPLRNILSHPRVDVSLMIDSAQNGAGTFGPCLCQLHQLKKRSMHPSPIRYMNFAGALALTSAVATSRSKPQCPPVALYNNGIRHTTPTWSWPQSNSARTSLCAIHTVGTLGATNNHTGCRRK